jgi:CPA1 family monovalent cation:H+ antiporter
LFDSLTDDDLQRVADWFEVRTVDSGKRLTSEGSSGYRFFVIQEGTAEVRQGEQIIRELGPGDFFGEVAMLDSGRRTADVVATSPMQLAAIPGMDFRRLQQQFPDIANRIEAIARKRSE